MKARAILLLCLLAGFGAGIGCQRTDHGKGESPVLDAVREWQHGRSRQTLQGEELYLKYCAICHGEKADGKGFNADLLDPKPPNLRPLANPQQRALVLKVIANGSTAAGKSPLCPPWGKVLTNEQRQDIFDHIVFLAGQAPAPAK